MANRRIVARDLTLDVLPANEASWEDLQTVF
ncbi:MAG: hypothetical protein QOC59_1664, partial [Microbacteriaceae bacterium]|nr:hypothetical protein [Microbacteriaceae bacterium]